MAKRSLWGYRKCSYDNLPVLRHRDGTPKRETRSHVIHSCVVRRILHKLGVNATLAEIQNEIRKCGDSMPAESTIRSAIRRYKEQLLPKAVQYHRKTLAMLSAVLRRCDNDLDSLQELVQELQELAA